MFDSGASEEVNSQHKWILQVVKQRTFKEKPFGKKMGKNNDCLLFLNKLIENENSFSQVTVGQSPQPALFCLLARDCLVRPS